MICRSGTEEEYSELSQLLEDISSDSRDVAVLQMKEKELKKKEQSDKRKGEEVRKAEMELLGSKCLCCFISSLLNGHYHLVQIGKCIIYIERKHQQDVKCLTRAGLLISSILCGIRR